MASCNTGILIMPPLFGFIAQGLGLNIFPIYLSVLYVLMVVFTIIYSKQTSVIRKKRLTNNIDIF
jgi:fucose permease